MQYAPARTVAVPGRARRRLVGFACAAALQGAMVWALMSGLSIKDIPVIFDHTTAVFIPADHHPLPPPDTHTVEPDKVWVPKPDMPAIDTGTREAGITVFDTRLPPAQPSGPADRGPLSVTATHTIPPYPPLDIRLGNEGTVLLRLNVGPDGRVSGAQVVRTSGFERLDQAACAWVIAHWRYQAAIRGGVAVPSVVDVAVKFSLKSAG